MRNLFRLVLKNHFVILFILLELVSFYLLVNKNDFHRANYMNSVYSLNGRISKKSDNLKQYFRLREENEQLVQENLKLKSNLHSYQYAIENKIQEFDTLTNVRFSFTKARVINNSVNKQYNYITLNKGIKHGFDKDMGVISSMGVVGIVKDVSRNFASVISLLNRDFRVSGKIKNTGYYGPVIWEGQDYQIASLNEIPYHVKLNIGDTIVTSGYSTTFPEGVTIGYIKSFDLKESNFYTIQVTLSTDFKNLNNVTVVKNRLKNEQLKLEQTNE